MMKTDSNPQHERLYLDLDHPSTSDLPLHTSITLFLLSYCECKSFQVFLVSSNPRGSRRCWLTRVPEFLGASEVCAEDLPGLVSGCRLPAVLDATGRYCRAGLAVVLRYIVSRTVEADSSRGDVSALLGFKSTCLKACAEVSPWTRLCELSIPSAVESRLLQPSDQSLLVPDAILQLEKRLGEPVKVHNDDKIRRQKLRLRKRKEEEEEERSDSQKTPQECTGTTSSSSTQKQEPSDGLELQAALAKLSVGAVPPPATRECSEIRKVKTAGLPSLEHVFAEGLYFTLTDVVLLPCIHHFLISLLTEGSSSMLSQLPLLLRWYLRVQEVPGVVRAAKACGLVFCSPQAPLPAPPAPAQPLLISEAQQESLGTGQVAFVGGPRPTMTKLKGQGIEPIFSAHPCPSWSVSWDKLPASVNPTEGNMSDLRAVRKRQQLNNLVAMVTELIQPGQTVVDFCSGGGHVGIVLAHSLPHSQVILIENKEESLIRAHTRSSNLGLTNIHFIQANLDYFTGTFHVGVALHACGVATDMVMSQCIQAGAAFVISPCCYGFIQNTLRFTFPRSKRFQEILSYKEHMVLCRFADQTAGQLPPDRRVIGKQCMGLVDLDRSWAAEDCGYLVRVMTMEPESCSPKNNMLVGALRLTEGETARNQEELQPQVLPEKGVQTETTRTIMH